MTFIHGGDIYRNQVTLDFSVSINPLGMPEAVRDALCGAVAHCGEYPDMQAERLREAVSAMLGVRGEWMIFGNGASELLMAIVHGLAPRRVLVPVPSFYGYEHAAIAGGGEILFCDMRMEDGFSPGEKFLAMLERDIDMVFLANPNNPTGKLLDKNDLNRLLRKCRDRGIYVVLDECFMDFCENGHSAMGYLEEFRNLILVRAFTKIFSIPGVRLGYVLCAGKETRDRVQRQLPEWNLSVFAQAAGCACAAQKDFVRQTVGYVKAEREFLARLLTKAGVEVLSGEANFLFVHSEWPLYEELLKRGILIRDCESFRGLEKGYYRIAVKSRAENEILIGKMREFM